MHKSSHRNLFVKLNGVPVSIKGLAGKVLWWHLFHAVLPAVDISPRITRSVVEHRAGWDSSAVCTVDSIGILDLLILRPFYAKVEMPFAVF